MGVGSASLALHLPCIYLIFIVYIQVDTFYLNIRINIRVSCIHVQYLVFCQKWLGENSQFLLHFLIHMHVLIWCRKFELFLIKIGFFYEF